MKIFKDIFEFLKEFISNILVEDDFLTDYKRNYSKYSRGYKYY